MQNNRCISIFSLFIATIALAHSLWLHSKADTYAVDALQRREAELVKAVAPKVISIYSDVTGKSLDTSTFHPTTIEELLSPIKTIISKPETPESTS